MKKFSNFKESNIPKTRGLINDYQFLVDDCDLLSINREELNKRSDSLPVETKIKELRKEGFINLIPYLPQYLKIGMILRSKIGSRYWYRDKNEIWVVCVEDLRGAYFKGTKLEELWEPCSIEKI